MRRRGSYHAICQPRGTIPPWLTSLRNFVSTLMNGEPQVRCPLRVRDAPLLRAPRGSIGAAIALRENIWLAAENAVRQENPLRKNCSRFDFDFVFFLNRKVLSLSFRFPAPGFQRSCGNPCGNLRLLFFLVIEL